MSRFSEPPSATADGTGCGGEILLFGVRVKVDPMRKSASMNNLSEFLPLVNADGVNNNDEDFPKAAAAEDGASAGYASADDAMPLPGNGGRERKRGVPWTEEEHKMFLHGLQKVGKGNWRGISRDYVKSRTPTQVASHAQKYFFRRSNLSLRRRRSSVFDITTDSVAAMSIEQEGNQQDNSIKPVPRPTTPPLPIASNITRFPIYPLPATVGPVLYPNQESSALGRTGLAAHSQSVMLVRPVYILPMPTSSTMMDRQQVPIQPPPPLSNVLSLTSGQDPYARHILA